MAHELTGHPKGLAALEAQVSLRLCVDAAVIFEGHEVVELLQANRAGEASRFVAVFMVEERAGVTVSAATIFTDMGLTP